MKATIAAFLMGVLISSLATSIKPKQPEAAASTSGWTTIPDAPAPPTGIIGDTKKLVHDAQAVLDAFKSDGIKIASTVTLSKPPAKSPIALCPTCPVVTPRVSPAPRAAPQTGTREVRRPVLYRLTRGRRGG